MLQVNSDSDSAAVQPENSAGKVLAEGGYPKEFGAEISEGPSTSETPASVEDPAPSTAVETSTKSADVYPKNSASTMPAEISDLA